MKIDVRHNSISWLRIKKGNPILKHLICTGPEKGWITRFYYTQPIYIKNPLNKKGVRSNKTINFWNLESVSIKLTRTIKARRTKPRKITFFLAGWRRIVPWKEGEELDIQRQLESFSLGNKTVLELPLITPPTSILFSFYRVQELWKIGMWFFFFFKQWEMRYFGLVKLWLTTLKR